MTVVVLPLLGTAEGLPEGTAGLFPCCLAGNTVVVVLTRVVLLVGPSVDTDTLEVAWVVEKPVVDCLVVIRVVVSMVECLVVIRVVVVVVVSVVLKSSRSVVECRVVVVVISWLEPAGKPNEEEKVDEEEVDPQSDITV